MLHHSEDTNMLMILLADCNCGARRPRLWLLQPEAVAQLWSNLQPVSWTATLATLLSDQLRHFYTKQECAKRLVTAEVGSLNYFFAVVRDLF